MALSWLTQPPLYAFLAYHKRPSKEGPNRWLIVLRKYLLHSLFQADLSRHSQALCWILIPGDPAVLR